MEYWHIMLWENTNGICLVERDLLKNMRRREKFLYEALGEKMLQYTASPIEDVRYHQDLVKVKAEENMWELKFHLPKAEVRFLGCLTLESSATVFYSLYAFRKKDQKITYRHRLTARGRVGEFISQYDQQNGLQEIL